MIPKQFHGDVFPISGGILELNVPVSKAKLVYPEEQTLEVHSEEKKLVSICRNLHFNRSLYVKK